MHILTNKWLYLRNGAR